MPVYAYACRSCDNNFDSIQKIEDRNLPTLEPCKQCQGELYLKITSIRVIDKTGRLDNKKVPTDFKNLVAGIQRSHKQEFKG